MQARLKQIGAEVVSQERRSPEYLQQFVQSKHEEQTFSCFRHFDYPGQKEEGNSKGPTPLPMPQLPK